MSKIKSVSTYTRQDESSGYWSSPIPLGADIENIDITNEVTDGLDDKRATWSSLYQDSSFIVGQGDTGASAWSKFNKFRKRIATALAIYPDEGMAEEETWAQWFKRDLLDKAHPVGSYYWSSEPTNPSGLFGGTWERIEDKFIFAASSNHPIGEDDGFETITLTINEMPSHSHKVRYVGRQAGGVYGGQPGTSVDAEPNYNWLVLAPEGGGQPHNNMPPYITAYCWHRTA